MSTPLFLADTRVYIAGVLMPTIQVNITSSIDQPPTATIAMPADHRLFSVGKDDRIPVHVFQRETYAESSEFILIFEGVIVGRSYTNALFNRNITFNCVGVLNILNDVRVTFMHRFEDLYREAVPGNSEISQATQEAIGFPLCFILHGLNCTKSEQSFIRYPFQYMQNVYQYIAGPEALIDLDTGEPLEEREVTKNEHITELALFFARQAKMLKLMQRFTKIPYFDENKKDSEGNDTVWVGEEDGHIFPMLRSVQMAAAAQYIGKQMMSQQPDIQTARNLLDMVSQPMEFEFANFAAPAFYSGDKDAETYYEKTPHLVSSCLKPVFSESIPPMCNVIFRSQVIGIESQDMFRGTATRVQVIDTTSPTAFLGKQEGSPQAVLEIETTHLYPMREVKGEDLVDPTLNIFATKILDTEEFTGPVVQRVGTPAWWNWAVSLGENNGQDGSQNQSSGDGQIPQDVLIKQRMLHRQLLLARYMNYKISVTSTFNPYVTPGFPGVVFDALDTGMSFAGYILAVSHNISTDTGGMTTTIEMNYVRPLAEAAAMEIVHPVEELQKFIHDEKVMTEIYNAMLGKPKTKKEEEAEKQQEKADEKDGSKTQEAQNPQEQEGTDSNDDYRQLVKERAAFEEERVHVLSEARQYYVGVMNKINAAKASGDQSQGPTQEEMDRVREYNNKVNSYNKKRDEYNDRIESTRRKVNNEDFSRLEDEALRSKFLEKNKVDSNGDTKQNNQQESKQDTPKKVSSGMPGAEAKSFSSIHELYGAVASSEGNPQNDPKEAYAVQRRNICTFMQYLGFMGLSEELGQGPGGEEIPVGFSKAKKKNDKKDDKKNDKTGEKQAGKEDDKKQGDDKNQSGKAEDGNKQEESNQQQSGDSADKSKPEVDKEDFIGYRHPVYVYKRTVVKEEEDTKEAKGSAAGSTAGSSASLKKAEAAASAGNSGSGGSTGSYTPSNSEQELIQVIREKAAVEDERARYLNEAREFYVDLHNKHTAAIASGKSQYDRTPEEARKYEEYKRGVAALNQKRDEYEQKLEQARDKSNIEDLEGIKDEKEREAAIKRYKEKVAEERKNKKLNPKRETHTEVEAKPKKDAGKKEKIILVREKVDLRTLLKAVSQEAFSKHVYA